MCCDDKSIPLQADRVGYVSADGVVASVGVVEFHELGEADFGVGLAALVF